MTRTRRRTYSLEEDIIIKYLRWDKEGGDERSTSIEKAQVPLGLMGVIVFESNTDDESTSTLLRLSFSKKIQASID